MKQRFITLVAAICIMSAPMSFAAAPTQAATKVQATVPALFEGNFTELQWLNSNQMIALNEEESGNSYYLIDQTTKKALKIVEATQDIVEVKVSNDSKRMAMISAAGDLFIYSFEAKTTEKISTTTDSKIEPVWASDDSVLYYLMGEKIDTVVAYKFADKTHTNIVADKVPYKSDLTLTKDGKKVAYLVAKAGKTDDAAGYTVDTKGTEPQYYFYDTTAVKPVAVQMTTSTDNKQYGRFLTDGTFVYLSTDTEDKANDSVIRKISPDGKTDYVLYNSMYVTYMSVNNTDEILAVGTELNGNRYVKSVSMKGISTPIVKLEETVVETVARGTSSIAFLMESENGQSVAVLKGTKKELLTK